MALTQRENTEYEGHVTFSDGTVLSLQCHEGDPARCPGLLPNGYFCEGPCPDPADADDPEVIVI